MVKNITSFTRSGLSDWLVQRVSAVVLSTYLIFIFGFICIKSNLDYWIWSELFHSAWVRVFSLIALFSLIAHSWIGIWTILTDYLSVHLFGATVTWIRVMLQVLCCLVMLGYLVWGIEILWGI